MERHHPRRWLSAFGLSACLAGSALAEKTIEVFTTAGEPALNVPHGVAVIELDAPGRMDAKLSEDLPADPDVAAAMMRERMSAPDWQEIADLYADSYVGLARAWPRGVEKAPAVVNRTNGMEPSPPFIGVVAPHWWVSASLTSLRMMRIPREHYPGRRGYRKVCLSCTRRGSP